jgi:hypothetical protein
MGVAGPSGWPLIERTRWLLICETEATGDPVFYLLRRESGGGGRTWHWLGSQTLAAARAEAERQIGGPVTWVEDVSAPGLSPRIALVGIPARPVREAGWN